MLFTFKYTFERALHIENVENNGNSSVRFLIKIKNNGVDLAFILFYSNLCC